MDLREIHINICQRYEDIYKEVTPLAYRINYKRIGLLMDLELVAQIYPEFRWLDLMGASDGDFMHDIHGIRVHLDRPAQRMGDCFIPRFARPTRNYDAEQSNDLHAMCMDEINTFKEYFEVLKSSGAYMLKREVYNTVLGRMAERVARLISDQYDEDITVEKLGVFYREDPIHSGESEATKDHVHP